MARIGTFDPLLLPSGWFDQCATPEGLFDDSLIAQQSAETSGAVAESASAVDTPSALAAVVVAGAESVTATANQSASAAFVAATAETTAANDSQDGATVAGPIVATVDEQCAAVDSSDALGSIYAVGVVETASAVDAVSATGGADAQASGGGRARLYHFHNPRALTFDEFVGEHAFARDAASATVVRSAEVILLDRYREDEEIMLFAAGWR